MLLTPEKKKLRRHKNIINVDKMELNKLQTDKKIMQYQLLVQSVVSYKSE